MAPGTVLHLAPHPDDEALGAPATLLALRDAGHRVLNLACTLGRPEDRVRREAEVREACARAGFELLGPPAAPEELTAMVAAVVAREDVALVVSPSPHDGHPTHEAVGRAARDALERGGGARWWMWGLWADLPLPTLFSGFGEARLRQAAHVLAAHAGELARNDYERLLRARAAAAAVLGAERVFGFGAAGRPEPYAELLTEVSWEPGDGWRAGVARVLDPADPLAPARAAEPLGWWLEEPTFAERRRRARDPEA